MNLCVQFRKNWSNILGAIAVSHLHLFPYFCGVREDTTRFARSMTRLQDYTRVARARQKKVRLFVKMCRTLRSEDEQRATTMPSSSSSSQWWRGHTTVCPSVCLSSAEKAANGRAPRGPAWHSTRRTLRRRTVSVRPPRRDHDVQ